MLTVLYYPPRLEYLDLLFDFSRSFDVVIPEVPRIGVVEEFLRGGVSLDEVLMNIEYFDIDYARAFYVGLKRLVDRGVEVIPSDPYGERAIHARLAAVTGMHIENVDKYVLYIEARIGEVMRKYASSLSLGDFSGCVRYTVKYAKLDAERIRFKCELRARDITALAERLKGKDVLIHSDYYNIALHEYLKRKLGCKPAVIDLRKIAEREVGVEIPNHPGLELTYSFLRGEIDDNRLFELGAKTLIYVTLRNKIMARLKRLNPKVAIKADAALIGFSWRLGIDDARRVFELLTRGKKTFRVRL